MGTYERAAASALRMLTKYGQAVTLRSVPAGTYANGAVTGNTPVDTTRRGVLFDLPSGGDTQQNMTLIQQGYKQLYMDASGSAPTVADRVIVDSIEYVISTVKTLSPAGIPVLYELYIKT
jgi:hypothetical protein